MTVSNSVIGNMPEGPSVVILKEAVQPFKSHKIIAVSGNSNIDKNRLLNQKVVDFKSWGKHFLICLNDFTVRIHFLMWGSYTINEKKDRPVRLGMTFRNGELNFYSSSIRIIEDTAENIYDFSSDVMSDSWDPLKAKTKVILNEDVMVCDVLLEQDIFAGVGNIIKNEVLYRISLHPESLISQIPNEKIDSMILEARNYSFDFYNWKKNYELRTHWLVHRKKICQRCNVPLVSKKTGLKNRRSYYCLKCQILY